MSANPPSQEVQLLLAAEKKALERVSDARMRKAKRLKQAKEEAAAEIEDFKAEKEIQFHKYETEHMGSNDDMAKKIDRDTTDKLDTMKSFIHSTRSVIVDKLLGEVVTNIDARVHKNKQNHALAN